MSAATLVWATLCLLVTVCVAPSSNPTFTVGRGLGTAYASDGTTMVWAGGEQATVCQASCALSRLYPRSQGHDCSGGVLASTWGRRTDPFVASGVRIRLLAPVLTFYSIQYMLSSCRFPVSRQVHHRRRRKVHPYSTDSLLTDASTGYTVFYDTVCIYMPSQGTFDCNTLAPLQVPRSRLGAASANGWTVFAGGFNGPGLAELDAYAPDGSHVTGMLTEQRKYPAVAGAGTLIYIAGGYNFTRTSARRPRLWRH